MKLVVLTICINLLMLSCKNQQSNNNTKEPDNYYGINHFAKLAQLHAKLGEPKPGEWLYHHKEKGRRFEDYKKSKRACPEGKLRKIAILPLGAFTKDEKKLLEETAKYVSKFFMLDVELLGAISDDIVPIESRRWNFDWEQLHTRYILDSVLLPNIPDSAICFISITNVDLYPQKDWNFVFGQAYLTKRTGVSSFRRYFENDLDSSNYETAFERTIKTTTHELCHMFSLKHCKIYKCLLNGSNHMPEADSKPLWLCPECLAKLHFCIKFDLQERYSNLIDFFDNRGMKNEVEYYKKSKLLMEIR